MPRCGRVHVRLLPYPTNAELDERATRKHAFELVASVCVRARGFKGRSGGEVKGCASSSAVSRFILRSILSFSVCGGVVVGGLRACRLTGAHVV